MDKSMRDVIILQAFQAIETMGCFTVVESKVGQRRALPVGHWAKIK